MINGIGASLRLIRRSGRLRSPEEESLEWGTYAREITPEKCGNGGEAGQTHGTAVERTPCSEVFLHLSYSGILEPF